MSMGVSVIVITKNEKKNIKACLESVKWADEIIVVEGRADVINLLKYGIKNAIALNGAKAPPQAISDLSRDKEITLFVDGDRGGELITKNLARQAKVAYVAHAPDGKEVEELTQKEIIKALRAKEKWEGPAPRLPAKSTKPVTRTGKPTRTTSTSRSTRAPIRTSSRTDTRSRGRTDTRSSTRSEPRTTGMSRMSAKDKEILKGMSEDLIGSRGAFILDSTLNILGRVPIKELEDTLDNIGEPVAALVMDGTINSNLDRIAYRKRVKYIVVKSKPNKDTKTNVLTAKDL